MPLLRLLGLPTLFYCHFPDKLLAQKSSALRAAYRLPFDLYEELSTGCASRVLVNSAFTASVYGAAFPLLRGVRGMLGDDEPDVLHPAIDPTRNPLLPPTARRDDAPLTLVSINRFERKKKPRHRGARPARGGGGGGGANLELVLAGGWTRGSRNVEHRSWSSGGDLGVADARLARNVSDEERGALPAAPRGGGAARRLEHLGIAPLEAMARRPVASTTATKRRSTARRGGSPPSPPPSPPPSLARREGKSELRRMARRARLTRTSLDEFGEKLGDLLAAARNKQ